MYNVIIVDDEPVIRFGLKASVEWEKEGLKLLGDFPNGEEAFKVLEDHRVDLLITDIKMPIMDGITLMKKALGRYPSLKVILVSSYTDFEYVREGLKLGAIDYVLKPTLEPEEFTELIRKCVKKIEADETLNVKIQLASRTEFLKERKYLEQAIKGIILENVDSGLTERYPQFDWVQSTFLMFIMCINHQEEIEENFGFYKTMVLDDVQDYFYQTIDEGICFPVSENELLFLVKTNLDSRDFIEKCRKEIEQKNSLSFSFGFQVVPNFSFVKEGFEKCRLACSRRFFHATEAIFRYEPYPNIQIHSLSPTSLPPVQGTFDQQIWEKYVNERIEAWKSESRKPDEIKKEACEMIGQLFIKQLKIELLFEKYEELMKTETLVQLKAALIRLIAECDSLNQGIHPIQLGDNLIMTKALEYIHDHYTEELTLNMVANFIHISRNYFSVLFKRNVGQNFIDYVIELRIKRAKELLVRTSLRVYEVAEQSGFNDVKYFSKLFKRLSGSSPADYRTLHHN